MAAKATKARTPAKRVKRTANNLSTTRTLTNLVRQRDDIEFQIAEARRTLREDVRANVMQTIKASGFTVQELFGSVVAKTKRRTPGSGGAPR